MATQHDEKQQLMAHQGRIASVLERLNATLEQNGQLARAIEQLTQVLARPLQLDATLLRVAQAETSATSSKQAVASNSAEPDDEKMLIGSVETVWFPQLKKRIESRIDTGAQSSSLNVAGYKVFERDGDKWVRFTLGEDESKDADDKKKKEGDKDEAEESADKAKTDEKADEKADEKDDEKDDKKDSEENAAESDEDEADGDTEDEKDAKSEDSDKDEKEDGAGAKKPRSYEQKLVRYVNILQSAADDKERRPVIKLRVVIGSVAQEAEFTLADRDHLSYDALIGRNALRDLMIVDVSKSHVTQLPDPEKDDGGDDKEDDKADNHSDGDTSED